jgi:hypothetical protein
MKRNLYLIFIILGVALLAAPVSNKRVDKNIWFRIDSLEAEGLFRTALELTEQVYSQSKLESNPEGEIKALIYKLKYIQVLEEDGRLQAISMLKKELPDERLVQGALKHSILAELYYRYYSANRWQISQNAPLAENEVQPIENWPPDLFYNIIHDNYGLSLQRRSELSKVKVGSLKELWIGNLADTVNKPSLYDILISRGVDFIQNADEFSLPVLKPTVFCSAELFSEPTRFDGFITSLGESGRNPYLTALNWYNQWLQGKEKTAMVFVDLKRLQYVHAESCNESRDSLYKSGLMHWTAALVKDSAIASVYESLALFHLDRGASYRINDPDTQRLKMERKYAADWLEKSKVWASTLAGKRCENLLAGLMKPELYVQAEPYLLPSKPFPVSLEFRNVNKLSYRVIKMNAISFYSDWDELEPAVKKTKISRMTIIKSGEISIPDDGLMNPHRANFMMEPLPAGFYILVFSSLNDLLEANNLVVMLPVSISKIAYLSRSSDSNTKEFYFRNRDLGSPLADLKVVPFYVLYDHSNRRTFFEKGRNEKTGKEGFLELSDGGPGRSDPSPKAYRLEITDNIDTLVTREMFYPGYRTGQKVLNTRVFMYTDRSLYKPGEDVFFRGVLIDYVGDSMSIHRTDSIILNLQDPRYQIVTRITAPVDSMGVFTGMFKLPLKGLTGNYLIQSKYGQSAIRMEQYKRPGFSMTLARTSDIYNPGDTIEITGKVTALSGEPVTGAEIHGEVFLQPSFAVRGKMPFNNQKIRISIVKAFSDNTGAFSLKWISLEKGSIPFIRSSAQRYTVIIKVTDMNGETQHDETTVDCGRGSTNLYLKFSENNQNADSLSGEIGALCSDGRPLGLTVKLVISKLIDPVRTWIEPKLPEPDLFLLTKDEWEKSKTSLPYRNEHLQSSYWIKGITYERSYFVDSITRLDLPSIKKWSKGWYKIELFPIDSSICEKKTQYIHVDSSDPRKIASGVDLYAKSLLTTAKPGQSLQVSYASGIKGFVMVDLQKSNGKSLTRWYSADKRTRDIDLKVTDEWQGGALLRVIMIHSNRIYQKNFPISVSWENSKLKISGLEELSTVKPGDSVSLNLRVVNEQGLPVQASLGMSVYDASLDMILPHHWEQISRRLYHGGSGFEGFSSGIIGSNTLNEPWVKYAEVAYIEPITLNWFGFGYFGMGRMDVPMMKMAMTQTDASRGGVENDTESPQAAEEVASDIKEEVDFGKEVQIRSDFRETAMFEGILLTDIDGMVNVRFKVPEVFTEWKALITGHDKNLAFGNLEHHFKSSQELMLKPYFPEFARRGDTLELAAQLGWYGKGDLDVLTRLVLSDSAGGILKSFSEIRSTLWSGKVVPFRWSFSPTLSEPFLYTLLSESPYVNDGLRDTVVVYPDEVELWNSQPFFFSKPEIKQLRIEEKPLEAVFEITTNPVWQILQSLPVVTKIERDCSEYWFSRLYLACLAGSIYDKYPDISTQYLQDTTAIKQKAQFLQVREWMDPSTRRIEQAYVLEKLSDFQNQDGTWPWYKGMGSDLFITQQIISGFGEMKKWGVFDITNSQQGTHMITRSIEAMDNWMYRQYREVIRLDSANLQKVHLDPMVIHYLYARSFYPGLSLSPANELAWKHFLERIPGEWKRHDSGLQALMAIASVQLGRASIALPIFRSLREIAKKEDQWGIHWPRKGMGSSWYNWDLWMQSRMIELFSIIEEGQHELDQLKLYLIHQKRGRDWGNGLVAAWATKSLLFYGNQNPMQQASVEMEWGKMKYSPLRIKTGSMGVTGYYKYDWKKVEDIPGSPLMKVAHLAGGPAWGTLFTLNMYKLDNLSKTGGPLVISRDVLKEDDLGRWTSIRKDQKLAVGDKIRIRLNIQSDRELSYVEIRDYLGTGFKPLRVVSGYQYHAGTSYYQSREPEAIVFFISQLTKGINSIDYEAIVEQAGSYFGGYATATSLYAPEFRAWSGSFRIHAER